MPGLSPAGFDTPTIEDIKAGIETALKAAFGAAFLVGDENKDSAASQLVTILAERELEIWDQAQAVYLSQYIENSSGESLENAVAYLGIKKIQAAKSKTDPNAPNRSVITGTPTTSIPANSIVSVVGIPTAKFKTLSTVVIGGGGTIEVDLEALDFGPITAPANTLTVIVTPVAGWASITNPVAVISGRFAESDEELRSRWRESLTLTGSASVDAITARLKNNVAGVINANIFENSSDVTDGGGRPPHSFEAVVDGGTDQAVADEIWKGKPAGIATFGTIPKTVTDQQGDTHVVNFSRPTLVYLRFIINVTRDPTFTQNTVAAATEIHDRVLAFLQLEFTQGKDILEHKIIPVVDETPGIEEIEILLSRSLTDPPPVPTLPTNIVIAPNEKPTFLSANILVIII